MSEIDPTGQTRQWSDQLSGAWERHRQFLFESERRLSEWLVDQVDPQVGDTILELAAGPGETGFLAAERLGDTGRLISTDLGAGMVAAAQRGAEKLGLDNVECRVMDAQQIDLDDDSIDGVLCRFGLMLMPEPARALAGVRRVLRPGRRLAYGVWGPPDKNPWLTLMVGALLQNGHQPPGDPFGPGGPFSLADPAQNRALLDDAGFTEVDVEELSGSMAFADFDQYWTVQSEVSGPVALLIGTLASDETEAIRETLEPMLAEFQTPQGYEFPWHTLGVSVR